jgi:hypothetical protein
MVPPLAEREARARQQQYRDHNFFKHDFSFCSLDIKLPFNSASLKSCRRLAGRRQRNK